MPHPNYKQELDIIIDKICSEYGVLNKVYQGTKITIQQSLSNAITALIEKLEIDLLGHQHALEILVDNLGLPKGSNYSDISALIEKRTAKG